MLICICSFFSLRKSKNRQAKAKKAVAARKANQRARLSLENDVANLRHNTGKAYTLDQNRTAILVCLRVKQELSRGSTKPTKHEIVARAAWFLCRGQRNLWDVYHHYDQHKEVIAAAGDKRGCILSLSLSLCYLVIVHVWMRFHTNGFLQQVMVLPSGYINPGSSPIWSSALSRIACRTH